MRVLLQGIKLSKGRVHHGEIPCYRGPGLKTLKDLVK